LGVLLELGWRWDLRRLFGPGGGTFMLLGLLWAAKLPLFEALLLSKLANTVSAGVSLISYGAQGFVHPREESSWLSGLWRVVFRCSFCYPSGRAGGAPCFGGVVILLLMVQLRELIISG